MTYFVMYKTIFKTLLLLGSIAVLSTAGCQIIGAIAAKAPKPDIEAAYKGLANKSVGVMVWTHQSLQIDWPSIQLDLAASVEKNLRDAQEAKIKDLDGVTFPYPAASFVKFRKEHPEVEAQPVTTIATRLGVQRLIYIEVNDFTTRAQGSAALFLGQISVNMKVVEVEPGQHSTSRTASEGIIGYEESNITAQFPEKATREGTLNGNDRTMYVGAVRAVAAEIAQRLIQHPDLSN
jgi:hypothetical protein